MEQKTKYLLWGLGAVAVGTGGYFLFKHLQSKKDNTEIEDFKEQISSGESPVTITKSSDYSAPSAPAPARSNSGSYRPTPTNSTFPLKRKSKGTLVKDVQLALIKQFGSSILPKYGADGYYGAEMEAALVSKGFPKVIDNETYAKIVIGKNQSVKPAVKPEKTKEVGSKTISYALHKAIEKDDIVKALYALKLIRNGAKYTMVNEEFKKVKIGLVSKTIVNALHVQFNTPEYKKRLNAEFYRMGLKYDGSKWSLSGLGYSDDLIQTITKTWVWDKRGRKALIPKFTILGHLIRSTKTLTEFETRVGITLFVKTNAISYAS